MPTHAPFKFFRSILPAGVALVCAIAWQTSAAQTPKAQDAATPANALASSPANPAASVPPVSYRSVFKETSLGVEKDGADWRKANDEVGKFTRGHVDILKWEEQEAAKAMDGRSEKPAAKPMEKPTAAPDAMTKPVTPGKADATKPIAAPAHKH